MSERAEVNFDGKKLLIGLPAFDGKVPVEWMLAFTGTVQLANKYGVEVGIHNRSNSSLIPKCRDELIHQFLFETDYDYLLCIDSDVIWTPKDVLNTLYYAMSHDVVFGAYPVKQETPEFHAEIRVVDGKPEVSEPLLRVNSAAAGFMMTSREILQGMRDKYEELHYTSYGDFVDKEHKVCAMFTPMIYKDTYRGEDVAFCIRLTQVGYKLWVNPEIHLKHIGTKAYDYSYKEYLLNEVVAH